MELWQNQRQCGSAKNVETKVRNGMTVVLPEAADGEYRVYGTQGDFLALGRVEQGKLHTVKSLKQVSVPSASTLRILMYLQALNNAE